MRSSGWIGWVMVIASAAWAQPAPDLGALASIAGDGTLPSETRVDAAVRMIEAGVSGEATARLRTLLADPEDRTIILRALALNASPPMDLEPDVLALPLDPEVMRALVPFRTKRAARTLLDAAVRDEIQREHALAALRELTGRGERWELSRWVEWFAVVEHLPDSQWQRTLVEGLGYRLARRTAERDGMARRLVEVSERAYRGSTPEARGSMLAAMLRDDVPEVRSLAFRLSTAELEDGRALPEEVSRAALSLLTHTDLGVRTLSARLIDRIAPPGAGPDIRDALSRETRQAPAAAMLRAAARFPTPSLATEAFRWLAQGEEASVAAIEALLVLHRAGMLAEPDRAAALLIERGPDQVTPAGAQLLSEIGGARGDDVLRLALAGASPSARAAAAEAVWRRADFLDVVTTAASTDTRLVEAATRAILLHDATSSGFLRLSSLPFATEDARRAAQAEMVRRLPALALVALASRATTDASSLDLILSPIVDQDRTSESPEDPAEAQAIAQGALLLARARIDLGRPEGALSALRWAGAAPDLHDLESVRALRVVALLMLGRIDEAAQGGPRLREWTEGLERSQGQPHALRIIEHARAAEWVEATPEDLAAWNAAVERAVR